MKKSLSQNTLQKPLSKTDLEFTLKLLSTVTAPFRESWVTVLVHQFAEKNNLAYFEDKIGNLYITSPKLKSLKQAPVFFVAHLDHPGFVVEDVRLQNGSILADTRWLGHGPNAVKGHAVKLFGHAHAGIQFDGKIESVTYKHMTGSRAGVKIIERALMRFVPKNAVEKSLVAEIAAQKTTFKTLGPWGACFDFGDTHVAQVATPSGQKKQAQIVSKSCDDLIGVAALLLALKNEPDSNVVICLTRAEECGFHGALEVIDQKIFSPEKQIMISVESSAQLPLATLGNGPVIRLGDRSTLFDGAVAQWIEATARALQQNNKSFTYQKRVMDGGTCEATAFLLFGYKTGGLSIPLKNYHNVEQVKLGATKAVPEAVALDDFSAAVTLLTALFQKANDASSVQTIYDRDKNLKADILKNHKELKKYF